jgi:CheY-like chemotaxis protein
VHPVLVVEDEALVRLGTVALLEDAGYQTLEAGNAEEAIAILEKRSDIRVVVTDIHMPGSMDGVRLAHYVRDRWPPIHLIVVSGVPNSLPLPEKALFFSKPYKPEAILTAFARLLADGPDAGQNAQP